MDDEKERELRAFIEQLQKVDGLEARDRRSIIKFYHIIRGVERLEDAEILTGADEVEVDGEGALFMFKMDSEFRFALDVTIEAFGRRIVRLRFGRREH
ncbi:MAG: hypothetical protein GDA50_09070 [Alphaproteobacteria bacterium GM202ARS2]|nr:hypothetical protein [Alphaproteobacteria bacterium GM202ARS2]